MIIKETLVHHHPQHKLLKRMPRGTGTLSAQKCPHFDVSKSQFLESFSSTFKRIKMASVIENLKPSAKMALTKLCNLKVRTF